MTDGAGLKTARTRLRRFPSRGHYDRETIYRILDEGLICHLGFVRDGMPFVVPTAYGRVGDAVYVHGSAASRALRVLKAGGPVCLSVTLTDGIVLARTSFNHSFNYRSVTILGVAEEVVEPEEKTAALARLTEQLVPGRWADVRWPTPLELKATSILRLPIEEASAKIRTGPPGDEGEELDIPCWAGVIPLELRPLPPIPDPKLRAAIDPPAYVRAYTRPGWVAASEISSPCS
jgi:hypothetical protein